MLEVMLFKAENKHDVSKLIFIGFLISFILGIVNSYLG
jgi:hypothetical protein